MERRGAPELREVSVGECATAAYSAETNRTSTTFTPTNGRLKEWMQTSAWRVDQGQGPLPPIAYSLDFPDEMIAALLPIWARQAETEDSCLLPRS